jgi:hypothetical protein
MGIIQEVHDSSDNNFAIELPGNVVIFVGVVHDANYPILVFDAFGQALILNMRICITMNSKHYNRY